MWRETHQISLIQQERSNTGNESNCINVTIQSSVVEKSVAALCPKRGRREETVGGGGRRRRRFKRCNRKKKSNKNDTYEVHDGQCGTSTRSKKPNKLRMTFHSSPLDGNVFVLEERGEKRMKV